MGTENPYQSPSERSDAKTLPMPRMHWAYIALFCCWSVIPILLGLANIGRATPIGLVMQALALIFLAALPCLFHRSRWGVRVVTLAIGFAWSLGAYQTLRRLFAVLTGTIEGPDGMGSPMAFLANWLFELAIWVFPATCLLGYTIYYLYVLRRARFNLVSS